MKRLHIYLMIGLILALAIAGVLLWRQHEVPAPPADVGGVVQDDSGKTVLYWYDPMVPGQKFDKPGKSPFMDMQLVPRYAEAVAGVGGVTISAQTRQNLGIRLATVASESFGATVTTVGRIEADERRIAVVQTRIPGFVERLLVRAVGDPVAKGQKVAEVYAPELLGAQQEYLALLGYQDSSVAEGLVAAARRRLQLLGMSEAEISQITQRRQPQSRFGVYAPAAGVVTELNVREGGQLGPGSSLMQLNDLSRVWLIAELAEQDAARFGVGSAARLELPGLPSASFDGRISYLYPTLDTASRTLPVRIELANGDGRLRPGMYGTVTLQGELHEGLAVPSESVIETGQRRVVIVRQGDGFRPAEVVTGRQADGRSEILQGLHAGEQVVLSGQFLIDSEASLRGVLARLASTAPAPAAASAAGDKHDDSGHGSVQGAGKVVAVDAQKGAITLAHEPIATLQWPAMTMDFEVHDPAQLAKLQAGDPVVFELMHEPASDSYAIHRIEKRGGRP